MNRIKIIAVGLCLSMLFAVSLMSSSKSPAADIDDPKFEKRWKKVDSLERKGLYRMAMTEVGQIFQEASKANLHNQVIKAVLFELKYNAYLEEDDYVIGIAKLDDMLKQAPSPSKEILHSLIAEVYWGYYSANTWKFNDRTNVVEVDLKDIRTWDLRRIAEKVKYHYLQSLKNKGYSQGLPIADFDEIVNNADRSNDIRPTLFDFLGHRALDFFKNNTFNIPGPAETFVIEEGHYFAGNSTFLSLKPTTVDSFNTNYYAVLLLQELTRFHLDEKNTTALFHVELERMKFMRQKAFNSDKDQLFYTALQRMTNAYANNEAVAEAWYEIASYHNNEGNTYNHMQDTTKRWERKKAVEICDQTISKYSGSYGARQCEALKSSILNKELSAYAEQAIPTNTKNKFVIDYRNADTLYLKIARYDYKKVNARQYKWDKFVKELREIKGEYTSTVVLENPGDYQKHTTEELIPELENGFYYIILGSDPTFKESGEAFSFTPLWVSDITYQTRRNKDNYDVLISDRITGEPLSGAKATVSYMKYNYRNYKDERKVVGTYTADSRGRFTFEPDKDYRTYNITVQHDGQVYAPNDGVYSYRYYNNSSNYYASRIFTDRKIYRPGQTIYFKGILINYAGDERKLDTDHETTVYFYDVNGEEVGRQKVKTNQFGSYEGEFTAPFGVLTGQMRIYDSYGSQYFRVEEYKRPKFFVEMDPVEGEFKVNDEIKTTGKAEAYAGNRLDGAKLKYRVVRSTSWSSWWYWWGWRPYTPDKEVKHGDLVTDENGEFEITFDAVPDKSIDKDQLPIFTYTVYVDVTDINGEVHSTSTRIIAGYQSLQLGHNIQSEMNNEDDYFLRVSTTNLNGQKISAAGSMKISKLKTPDQPYYERLWSYPDLSKWTKEEHDAIFPHESYRDENSKFNWEVDKEVFKSKFDTKETDSIAIPSYKNWKPGVYLYESTAKDKNGIEVKDRFYFTVYNSEAKVIPNNAALWVKLLKWKYEPGETAEILLGSADKDLRITYDIEVKNKIIKSEDLTLNKEQRKIKIPVIEEYRGNFTVHFSAVKNNRRLSQSVTVTVPYTNKELDLEFSTFRNKLLPGDNEEWTLTIKNARGEKEQAELLATLYDASLDALFTPNDFYMSIYNTYYGSLSWSHGVGMNQSYSQNQHYWNSYYSYPYRYFPSLNYHGWSYYYYPGYYGYRGGYGEMDYLESEEDAYYDGVVAGNATRSLEGRKNKKGGVESKVAEVAIMDADEEVSDLTVMAEKSKDDLGGDANNRREQSGEGQAGGAGGLNDVKARSNFNETAFFMPQLTTDSEGNVKIKFTIPESLTKWKFLGLAHTKDLKIGNISEEVVTQKDLMVVPNAPRFLREGDKITLSTKISNISSEDLEGKVQLSLSDPSTDESLDKTFKLADEVQDIKIEAGKSISVSWTVDVPYELSVVKYRIVAKCGSFSDGEENVLPILSNRMLVTEALPLPIRGNTSKKFKFEKLLANNSTTLRHHAYTLEFTSNPAWYALQAMPYMMEYPYECAEQTFTRYYSNAIATHVMNSNPKIKMIIEKWGEESPDAFLSNLQKNQELKSVILEETPWVLDAKNEEQSKRNLAILLDMNRMSKELDKALSKTIKSQSANGGWPWFPGMRESRYITQHIVTGMGHLDHLGIKDIREKRKVWNMVKKGVKYLDRQIRLDYQNAKKYDPNYRTNQHIGYTQVQYLYARSYFPKIDMSKAEQEAVMYYKEQAEKFWLNFNIYGEGMIALAAHRFEMTELATDVVKSLKDRSIHHDEFGMYWKDYYVGYYWYEAPVETQALMIEMFDEVTNDQESVEELKIWLLKEKQTTNWKTTKQTAEAVYALLLKGSDLLASDELVQINLGGQDIQYVESPKKDDPFQVKAQAGTGYFKTRWNKEEVKPELGDITVTKKDKGIAWGAAYWQYFEDLDKITFAENNLKLNKQLFLVEVTDEGEKLKPVNDNNVLHVGDKVRVRIELRTDRNLEYVHMKDMRASGFEPLNVLSRYYYQDGLGYYQATKDAATNFFFDYVPKGTHVFEYNLWVQHKGDFSNGITTIQCMYAPEFTSHSDGIRVKVE